MFNKEFFKKHQSKLIWLLNTPFIKIWFRWCLRINFKGKITELTPNSFSWGDRYFKKENDWFLERTTDFRTHNRYSKRLYFAFYSIWWIIHFWDWILADKFIPRLSFGFATLTKFPDPDPESTSVDGDVVNNAQTTWALARDAAAGTIASPSAVSGNTFAEWIADPNFYRVARAFTLFDTSALGVGSTISSAIHSAFGAAKDDGYGNENFHSVETAPATNTDLIVGDFDLVTFTTLGSITMASFSTTAYNDITLNATGLTKISKTGITKLGFMHGKDLTNTAPTTQGTRNYSGMIFADTAGTTQDPKLVVTYIAGVKKNNLNILSLRAG